MIELLRAEFLAEFIASSLARIAESKAQAAHKENRQKRADFGNLAHQIAGEAEMLALKEIAALCHDVEKIGEQAAATEPEEGTLAARSEQALEAVCEELRKHAPTDQANVGN